MTLRVQVAGSIQDFDPLEWDQFGAGNAFQSHRWYAFGEKVMGDRPPGHLIVRQGDRPVARAVLRLIGDEPLRLPRAAQVGLHYVFRRYPLLICRSPLADSSGLILPEGPYQAEARS